VGLVSTAPPRGTNVAPPAPAELGSGVTVAPSDPLIIDQRTPDTDLSGAWGFSHRASFGGPNYVRRVEDDPFVMINPIGYYQGVQVGNGSLPPFAPREIGGQSAVLTWTGFERGTDTSRVFFQLSAAVEPTVDVDGLSVEVRLPQTAIKVRNNRRKLITKYFNTPVNEVRIRRKGKDVVVVLALRWEATPTWSLEPGVNGYQMLVFEFADHQSDDRGTSAVPMAPSGPAEADETAPFLPSE